MNQEILDYIKSQRIGVLAVEMPDGSPHAATVHFANAENPLIFYFETDRDYRKSEALFGRDKSRASFVVGVDDQNKKTLQIDGEVRFIKDSEEKLFREVYFSKFPEKIAKITPQKVFFLLTPTWWRYSDWTGPKGKVVITSDHV